MRSKCRLSSVILQLLVILFPLMVPVFKPVFAETGPAINRASLTGLPVSLLSVMGIGDKENSYPPGIGQSCQVRFDVVFEHYPVTGENEGELRKAICDVEQGSGPLEQKEGKRYASYVKADYSVDYLPRVIGRHREGEQVAVELGAGTYVSVKVTVCLPEFRTVKPFLGRLCDSEEGRLCDHEMEHVKAHRECAKALAGWLNGIRVEGYGPTYRDAWGSAEKEMRAVIDQKLDEAVELSEALNNGIDIITDHGLSIALMPFVKDS